MHAADELWICQVCWEVGYADVFFAGVCDMCGESDYVKLQDGEVVMTREAADERREDRAG